MLSVVPMDAVAPSDWDSVVHVSPQGWLFHLWDWVALEREVWGARSVSFLIRDEQRILAVCPLFAFDERVRFLRVFPGRVKLLRTGRMGMCEPALVPGLGAKQRERVLGLVFEYVDGLAEEHGADCFELALSPLAPANLPGEQPGVNPFVPYGLEDVSTWVYMQDLSRDLGTLRNAMSHALRKNIKWAERAGVRVGRVERAEELEEYYQLHLETYRRSGIQPHPFPYFEQIWDRFGTRGLAVVFYAQYQGRKIDFLNLACFKGGVMYWTTCSATETRDLRADAMVIHHVTRWARESGYRWVQVGEVFPNSPLSSKLHGIYRYKKGVGGDLRPYYKARRVYRPFRMALHPFFRSLRLSLSS